MDEEKTEDKSTNNFTFGDISSPSPSKRRRQNKNVENKPSKKKTSLNSEKQTPGKTNIKRTTVTGDEYQRILQVLIRHRSLQSPGVKVGTDVSDISALDDVVYYKEKSCKFFQIKHSIYPLTMAQLFKTDFPENTPKKSTFNKKCTSPLAESSQSPLNEESKESNRKKELYLALYFISFVNIKENSQFKHCEIEDLYFVTNQSLTKGPKCEIYRDFLTQVENSLKDDKLLYLKGKSGEKYTLNIELVKESFYDFLKKQYNEWKEINKTTSQPERFEELLNEFLSKIRVVIKYPDIKTVRDETMKEIFGDDIMDCDIRNILQHCLIHMEIELLRHKTNEYLSNKEWKSNIDRVRSLIEKLKATGITEHEKNRLTWKVGELRFQNESLNDMCEDLNIFLQNSDCRIFHLTDIENVELTVAKVLSLLNSKNSSSDYFIYCTSETLASTNALLNYYLNGNFKLLVIACDNENLGYDFKEMVDKIVNSIYDFEKKYIFISQTNDIFKTYIDTFNNLLYCKKQYSNGFKALNEESKLKVLNKTVTFQGKPILLGSIFHNSRNFAEEVIDDNCLWEIVNPLRSCTISNTDAFSSLGYDEKYYIPRKFHQKNEYTNEEIKDTPKNENEMIKLLGFQKTIILVGNSGEGKSTVLTHLANLLKKRDNNMWIIRVNLRIFFSKYKLKFFGDVANVENANKMAFKMAFPNEHNKLEEMLFKKGLQFEQLRVVFLLDGYNEIGSKTQNEILNFLKTVKSIDSIVQCWISTQVQEKMKLEKKLHTEAYFLESLSDEDQINLMVEYWNVQYSKKSPPELYNVVELTADASAALNRWKQYISDENERPFTSVSLNLKMLADILLQNNRKVDQHLNLLSLYDRFITNKFKFYSNETIPCCNYCARWQDLDSAKENLFAHSVHKVLQSISAKRIILQFSNDTRKFPGMEAYNKFIDRVGGDSEEDSLIPLSKIGLLTFKDRDFELSHESYVQFFFSEYVLNYFSSEQVQSLLMDHVLVKNSLQLCRTFIDRLIFNHMQNETEASDRKRPKLKSNLNQTKLSTKAQSSFLKVKQSNVVIDENLVNIIQFVLYKLTDDNQRIFLNRVVKHSLKALKSKIKLYTNSELISKPILNSIETKLNSISHLKIMDFLIAKRKFFSHTTQSLDEIVQRVNFFESKITEL